MDKFGPDWTDGKSATTFFFFFIKDRRNDVNTFLLFLISIRETIKSEHRQIHLTYFYVI
jgi:hypothetical protein